MSIEKQIEDRLAEVRGHIANMQEEERRLTAALAALRGQLPAIQPAFVYPPVKVEPMPPFVPGVPPIVVPHVGDVVDPPFTVTCGTISLTDSINGQRISLQ